jgi:GDP-mannose 4,6-dehydratase
MRVLITGITGMVGSHLAEYILANHPDVEVHGLIRWRSPMNHIRQIQSKVNLHWAELRDLNSLVVLFNKIRPDRIFHLAAQSFVTTSFDAPADTLHTNVIGTTNLLDAIRLTEIDPRVHICSSSEVYGQVTEDEVPINESNPFRPASPYAVSKVGEDMVALQYFLSYGIKTIRTRMFTHTGPRRGDIFAESAFAKQVAEIEAGVRPNPESGQPQ